MSWTCFNRTEYQSEAIHWHIFVFYTKHQRNIHQLLHVLHVTKKWTEMFICWYSHKPSTSFTYIGSIYGFQRRCMYVKSTWMDIERLLSRKEIPDKFLCRGNRVNLPPPLKYTGKTQTNILQTYCIHEYSMHRLANLLWSILKKKICQIFDVSYTILTQLSQYWERIISQPPDATFASLSCRNLKFWKM